MKKGLGDHRPAGSRRRAGEYELLALALAKVAGVRVPEPITITPTADGAALVVTREPVGLLVSDADDVDDAELAGLWREVSALHERRIAHRALAADVVVLSPGDGTVPTVTEFAAASLDANDEVLHADTANLIASLATHVGVERAAHTAATGLGSDALAAALPFVQPSVLTPEVRKDVRTDKELLGNLRTEMAHATGADAVELTHINRVTLKGVVSLVGSIVLLGYVISLASNWGDTWRSLRDAHWAGIVAVLIFTFSGFVGGTLSLMGATVIDLPFVRTLQVMFAQSYLNRFNAREFGRHGAAHSLPPVGRQRPRDGGRGDRAHVGGGLDREHLVDRALHCVGPQHPRTRRLLGPPDRLDPRGRRGRERGDRCRTVVALGQENRDTSSDACRA
jgi:hypothetical protein